MLRRACADRATHAYPNDFQGDRSALIGFAATCHGAELWFVARSSHSAIRNDERRRFVVRLNSHQSPIPNPLLNYFRTECDAVIIPHPIRTICPRSKYTLLQVGS